MAELRGRERMHVGSVLMDSPEQEGVCQVREAAL